MRGARLFVLGMMSLLGSCRDLPSEFRCSTAPQCTADYSRTARCEDTGYCSVMDPSCTSGWRYHAAGPYADDCVVGAMDLGSTDAPSPLGCAAFPSAFFCDDFELGLQSWWDTDPSETYVAGASTYMVDTQQARSGSKALHVHLDGAQIDSDAGVLLSNISTFAQFPGTGDVWLRAYYFVSAPMPNNLALFYLQQYVAPYGRISVEANTGHPGLSTDGQDNRSTAVIPTGKWTCIEVHLQRNDGADVVHYSVDGVEASGATMSGNFSPNPTYHRLRIGYYTQPTATVTLPTTDVWIDDLVVDTSAVGCAK